MENRQNRLGKDRGPGRESAAVIAADGNLYFRYQDGTMALIGATPDGYKENGVFKLPFNDGQGWPHPPSRKKLYLRAQDVLDVLRHRRVIASAALASGADDRLPRSAWNPPQPSRIDNSFA